jgi:type IV secretion system protein VirB5
MRNFLAAGVALLALTGTAHAQIPVTDYGALVEFGTSIADQVKSFGVQLQQQFIETKELIGDELSWTTQAASYARQGQQYLTEATQLAAFVHAPSMGAAMGILNMAGLGNALPASPYAVMGLVSGVRYGGSGLPQIQGVLSSLSGFSSSAFTANNVYTPKDGSFASREAIANANSIAGYQGAAQASVADYQAHQATFNALETRLQTATQPKDVQDIQAQIALQQTWFANEAGQMQAVTAAYTAQRDAMAQRGSEAINRGMDNFHNAAVAQGDGY